MRWKVLIWVARLRRAILPPARCAGDIFILYALESFNLGRAAAPRDSSSSALRWRYFYF